MNEITTQTPAATMLMIGNGNGHACLINSTYNDNAVIHHFLDVIEEQNRQISHLVQTITELSRQLAER